jgi:hypothetical protein
VNIGPIQAVALSTIQTNTNTLYANTTLLGNTSTATEIQFTGLFGNYNNTVLAEISTGAGSQELLVFRGSSSSDRVRVQTTGAFVVETGVGARLWSDTTLATLSNATPAFIVNTSSNVGIQTASPGATLDVAGTGRFQIASTLALNLSSLNGDLPVSRVTILSSVTGLGTLGYVSTASLVSTTLGLQRSGFLSSPNLLSTVGGLGTIGYVSTSWLNSTVVGLGTYGYRSTVLSSFLTISTGLLTTSTITLYDSKNFNSANTLYAMSTYLYFNNYVVAGATQLQPQIFNF